VNTANWPDINSVVINNSTMIARLRASSLQVFRSTLAPIKPAGSRQASRRKLIKPMKPMPP
jgi:hypothetical protein